jgi:hypothetical protein
MCVLRVVPGHGGRVADYPPPPSLPLSLGEIKMWIKMDFTPPHPTPKTIEWALVLSRILPRFSL